MAGQLCRAQGGAWIALLISRWGSWVDTVVGGLGPPGVGSAEGPHAGLGRVHPRCTEVAASRPLPGSPLCCFPSPFLGGSAAQAAVPGPQVLARSAAWVLGVPESGAWGRLCLSVPPSRPIASLLGPQATAPQQKAPCSASRPGRWGSALRTGGTSSPGRTGLEKSQPWGLETGSERVLDPLRGQRASTFGRYCSVFNYTKFPDFILPYQRHKMPAHSDQKKPQVGSQHGKFQWAWASGVASSESCRRLPVHRPPSRPEAARARGAPSCARGACARVGSMGAIRL